MSFLLDTTGGMLVLVYIGMTLIASEFFVKARGVAGLIGLLALATYFYGSAAQLSPWMVGLFVVGLVLIVVDGKFVQDGTLASIGAILTIISLVLPSQDVMVGTGVAFAFILGLLTSPLSFKVLPRRDMWDKITLKDRFTKETGYSSMNDTYGSLMGRTGKAVTDMRPSGTIEIDGMRYSAVTNGSWVEQDSPVEVESVTGTRILVREIEDGL